MLKNKHCVLLVLLLCSLANCQFDTDFNYCRQTKCGLCKNVGQYRSCERCVNSIHQKVTDNVGGADVWECVGSQTGLENCLTLHKPVPGATSIGCYYCANGYMLKAGTPSNGVTSYTCVAGTVENCAFYKMTGDLTICKYCKKGYVMDAGF